MCYLSIMVWLKIVLKIQRIAGSFEKKLFLKKRVRRFVCRHKIYLELQGGSLLNVVSRWNEKGPVSQLPFNLHSKPRETFHPCSEKETPSSNLPQVVNTFAELIGEVGRQLLILPCLTISSSFTTSVFLFFPLISSHIFAYFKSPGDWCFKSYHLLLHH